jgi:hypothetical protein
VVNPTRKLLCRQYELGERPQHALEFLDIAAAVGFDPGEAIRALGAAEGGSDAQPQ